MLGLIDDVVGNGYCIGCGVCKAVKGSPVQVIMDEAGRYQALLPTPIPTQPVLEAVSTVCPFSGIVPNEDVLGVELYPKAVNQDPNLGRYEACYAGFVREGQFRALGSSGGIAKWVLYELLRRHEVDAVVQVVPQEASANNPTLFSFAVIRSAEAVLTGARSAYYPVELSEVLAFIRQHPLRYAITGVPCFVKALRLLSRSEPLFRERIRYCVGIICGHLKSTRYADMIGWQLNIAPGNLATIDFRCKVAGATAKQKAVAVTDKQAAGAPPDPTVAAELFGTDYNHGFFQYRACDYCDDVVAELADISVGDAWLPEYIPDGSGTSLIITRHAVLHELLTEGERNGQIRIDRLSREQAIASQAGGFRQRRQGLAYRLHLADRAGQWRPQKRVVPRMMRIGTRRRRIYRLRSEMAEASHNAFADALEVGDFAIFRRTMEPFLADYRRLYQPPFWHRVNRAVQRRLMRWGGDHTGNA